MPRHRILAVAALAAATLALSACGDAGSGGADPYGSASDPVPTQAQAGDGYSSGAGAPSSGAASGGTAAGSPVLAAREAPQLGTTVVADAGGYTLYRFDKDTAKPPKATCADDCAAKWPPVVVDPEGKLTLEGVDQAGVGMVQRADGNSQLTLGGWPVYRYAGDTSPGATGGQGVGGTWFAITPDGKKATTP